MTMRETKPGKKSNTRTGVKGFNIGITPREKRKPLSTGKGGQGE